MENHFKDCTCVAIDTFDRMNALLTTATSLDNCRYVRQADGGSDYPPCIKLGYSLSAGPKSEKGYLS